MKKVFVIVPHQDDELNLVGNIIEELNIKNEVFVIYSSLDVRARQRKARQREAIRACSIMGIDKKHILFLRYPDTPNKVGKHFFSEGDHSIVFDYIKLLEEYRPEVIFACDFDYHCDHRMVSIAIEEAVRQVRMQYDYMPFLLKGFCYETTFYGLSDYSASALERCKVTNEHLSNPSFEWDKRISIFGDARPRFIFFRKLYWAIAAHKSQYVLGHALSIINADNVFWIRRTDNLLLDADTELKTSSGDADKLRDFKIIDTDDIITLDSSKINFSKALWKGDKNERDHKIDIYFKVDHYIKQIVVHGNPNCSKKLKVKFHIFINEKELTHTGLEPWGRSTIINMEDGVKCNHIMIRTNAHELSEIEVFESELVDSYLISYIGVNGKVTDTIKNKMVDRIDYFVHRFFMAIQKIRRIKNKILSTGV